MKILFITPYLPSEKSGHAGAQLIFRNISTIAKKHEIVLASFIDDDESDMMDELIDIGIDVCTIPYPRNQKSITGKISSGIRNSGAMVDYLQGKETFFFAKYKKKNMENLISTLVKENSFDMVQVEYNVMHHYTRQIGHIPRVIVFHDISTKVHERGMVNGDSNHKKSFEIAKRLEPEIGNKFDTVITLTEEDKLYLANLGCETKIQVIPPQINVPNIDKIAKTPNSICFVGSYNREPNIQAVEILISEVFPKISCSVSLNIVGKGLGRKIIQTIHNLEGVNYLGFVDDIDSFIASQMLMVAPIHIGAGLKMKIPHALACGTAVITTPVGAEGIAMSEEDGLWVIQTIETMINKINNILPQNDFLCDAGESGQRVVRELFSEDVIADQFEKLYSNLLAS